MPTSTQLLASVGGAIGSDFHATQNQLIFVEYSGKLSTLTIAPATPTYKVIGTGYTTPEDVKFSKDGLHAYVTERTGDLVKVSLNSANRSAATVIAAGMNSPQQFFLDEAHNAAYVVEYAAAGSLLKINLTTGAKTVITGALNFPVGVVLSSDLQFAYVSEQTTGPDKGRISRIQLSSASRTTIATGLTAPFFLTWADAAEDLLLVPQRDPSDSLVTVNVLTKAINTVATGLPSQPSSVVIPNPGQVIVCCNSVIQELSFITFSSADLLWGIGVIPVGAINTSGLATTASSYIYYVDNSPFGGDLPIIVNGPAIAAEPATYYQILANGVPQTNTWTAYVAGVATPISAQTIGGTKGCYPVAGLHSYYPPGIAGVVDSTLLPNSGPAPAPTSTSKIVIQLVNSAGVVLPPSTTSKPLTIAVNNQPSIGVLGQPTIGTATADACGLLHYGTSAPTINVVFPFTATQPSNYATYSFAIYRGSTGSISTTPALPSGVPVPGGSAPIQVPLNQVLGTCTTAGVAAQLYVAANITNGLSRQGQYDAESTFALAITK